MRNHCAMEFSLAVSRRDILLNTLQALKGQQDWLENHITVKSADALNLKNRIEQFEKKIAIALMRQAALEILAQKPKGLSEKQQQELEKCKKTVTCQDEVLRCKAAYNEWEDVDRENRMHIELLKYKEKEVRAELDQLLQSKKTPYKISLSIREVNLSTVNDSSNSTRPSRTR